VTRLSPRHHERVSLGTAVLTFAVVAAVLTITPGLDTALVLRSALTGRRREAVATAGGIVTGLFVWGAAAAGGVSALLTASEVGYDVLRFAGAGYLVWVGAGLLAGAVRGRAEAHAAADPATVWRAARTGLATNLLNPKVGIFYVALLPQFVPAGGEPFVTGLLLAGVHAILSMVWFTALISLAATLSRWLRRPATVRAIDGVTGGTLVGFGAALALGGR
jgi:threonine/homoserine/homoserine lactone efflux protein